jgi:hypothetical protein
VGISKPVTTPIIGNVVRSRYEIMFCILVVNSTKKGYAHRHSLKVADAAQQSVAQARLDLLLSSDCG